MVRKESLERTRRELDRLLGMIGEEKLVVVIIPPPIQITNSWIEKWIRSERINQMVISWCKAHDVPYIDLLDHMRGHMEYYHPEDKHYTSAGNNEVGRVIADFLVHNTGILN